MLRHAALRIVVLAGLLGLLSGAPAAAFTPPVLYVRETYASSTDHRPQSDWTALASNPTLNWLGGYEIGYAIQAASDPHPEERVGLRIDSVPGTLVQPYNTPPYCTGEIGQVGTIVALPYAIQFNGGGTYTITVGIGPPTGGAGDCLVPGPTTAATTTTFTVSSPVAPQVVGQPLIFRAKPLPAKTFAGVQASATPPGGNADVRCGLNATVNADGSLNAKTIVPKPDPSTAAADTGTSQIAGSDFPQPGAYTCVARAAVDGVDAMFSTFAYGTSWSAPLNVDVRSDFQRVQGKISSPHSRHPKITYTAQFPQAAAGGTLSFHFQQAVGCRKLGPRSYTYKFKDGGTFKAKFNARSATVTLRTPSTNTFSSNRWYFGTLSFGGTRFYTKSADPTPSLLRYSGRGALTFASPNEFPGCPGGFG